ncbi:MAG TPA: hypothetical protein VGW34_00715 [Allosphingosinicella sp.]|nr:hypothetical protein [Allosphingosinicella sp.]
MKLLGLLPLLAAAGCAGARQAPLDPVGAYEYGAMGHDPFWLVAIGGDRIVLTLGPEGGRADGELTSHDYPRALPRQVNGVRRWESGAGTQVIAVEARPQACTTGGRSYPDTVTVSLSGRMLAGCGGREPAEKRG